MVNRGKKKIAKSLSCCFSMVLIWKWKHCNTSCLILWLDAAHPDCKLYIEVTSLTTKMYQLLLLCVTLNMLISNKKGEKYCALRQLQWICRKKQSNFPNWNLSGLLKLAFGCHGICNDHKWSGPWLVFNLQLQQDSYANVTLENWFSTNFSVYWSPDVPPRHVKVPTQCNPGRQDDNT